MFAYYIQSQKTLLQHNSYLPLAKCVYFFLRQILVAEFVLNEPVMFIVYGASKRLCN